MPRGRTPKLSRKVLSFLLDELKSLKGGECLAPEVALAGKFGVSRKTVRSAMSQLERQGIINRVPGKGTFPTQGKRARALFRAPVHEIGLVSWELGGNEFYSAITDGAVNEAMHRQSQIVLSGGPTSEERTEACYRFLDDPAIKGIILFALTDQELLSELADRGKPICLVDHFSERAKVDCIRVDSEGGSKLAIDHLYTLGHRRIAFINTSQAQTNPARLRGYDAGLAGHRLESRPEWIVGGEGSNGGAQGALKLLALPEKIRPTAIFAFSDEMALGAIHAVMRFGLHVPDDLSIIGTGGPKSPLTFGMPELTSVRFDTADLGRYAVRHILDRISQPDLPPRNVMLPGFLNFGQSTDRPRSAAAKK